MRARFSALALVAALTAGAACSSDPQSADGDVVPASAETPLRVADARSTTVAPGDTVTVYKSPTCGCCTNWVDHMREAGFTVVAIDTSDVGAVKHTHGVSNALGSCHTSLVGGYVVEGHVPAADVKRLLAERPAVRGLAVPGMPMGSPGMEGPISQRYDVMAFDSTGATRVFASH